MIIIKRKIDEVIYIQPKPGTDQSVSMLQLFDYGPIGISIEDISDTHVKIGLCIPDELEAVKKEETE